MNIMNIINLYVTFKNKNYNLSIFFCFIFLKNKFKIKTKPKKNVFYFFEIQLDKCNKIDISWYLLSQERIKLGLICELAYKPFEIKPFSLIYKTNEYLSI